MTHVEQNIVKVNICDHLFTILGWTNASKDYEEQYKHTNCIIFNAWLTTYRNRLPDIQALHQIIKDICMRKIDDLSLTEEMISLWGFGNNSISINQFNLPVRNKFCQFISQLERNHSQLFERKDTNSSMHIALSADDLQDYTGFALHKLKPMLVAQQEVTWRTGALKRLLILILTIYLNEPSLRLFLHQHIIQAIKLTATDMHNQTKNKNTDNILNDVACAFELGKCTIAFVKLMQEYYK